MFRNIIAAIVLSTMAVPLAGCDRFSLGGVNSAVTTPLCSRTVADEKAYAAVLLGYNGVAGAYVSADKRKLIKEPLRTKLRGDVITLRGYREGAKAAYKVCNHDSLLQYKDAVETLSAKVLPLIPH